MPDRRQQGSPKRPRGLVYLLADIPADLYAAVKMRALEERRTVRQVIFRALRAYVQGGVASDAGGRQAAADGVRLRTVRADIVTVEKGERWHQFLALTMFKLRVSRVTVSTEDITKFAATYGPEAAVVVQSVGDRVTLRLVDETQAGQLARKA